MEMVHLYLMAKWIEEKEKRNIEVTLESRLARAPGEGHGDRRGGSWKEKWGVIS